MTDSPAPLRRIGYLSPCWPPERLPSGIAAYARNLAGGLESLGVQSDIYSLTAVPAGNSAANVLDLMKFREDRSSLLAQTVDRFRRRHSTADVIARDFGSRLTRGVRSIPPERKPQLIEVEETFGIARWIDTPGIPLVIRLHGPWFLNGPQYGMPLDRQFRMRCRAEFRAVRDAVAISAPSRHVLKQFLARLDGCQLPTEVIPNPVPAVSPEFLWNPRNDGVSRILYVGRFERIKGADIALQAFALVQRRFPQVEMAFVGSDNGLIDDDGHAWHFEDYVAARLPPDAAKKVTFLGKQPKARLDELRRDCQVGVIASRNETFPVTALEFQCAGVPTVASDVGGIPEIIEHDVNGLLFPAGQVQALADAISRVLTEEGLGARLGSAGRESSRRCDPAAVARQSLDFYETALRESNRAHG